MKATFFLFVLLAVVSCKTPEARKPVTKKSGHFIKTSIVRNKQIVARQEEKIKRIITRDSTHDYLTSPNGFWYRYNTKNNTDTLTPEHGDTVTFDYDISTLDGKTIYSREELGTREYTIEKENVFTGLRQGLQLLKKGETATFYFPSYKAFGYYGDDDKIGHNMPIKATITLNSINTKHNSEKQPFKR